MLVDQRNVENVIEDFHPEFNVQIQVYEVAQSFLYAAKQLTCT